MTTPHHRFSVAACGLAGVSLFLIASGNAVRSKEPPPQRTRRGQIQQNNARPIIQQPVAAQAAPGIDVLVQADRETIRALRFAKELIGRKEYVKAIAILQKIIDRDQDGFYFEDPEKRDVLRSVRTAAQQLIAGMPEAGRKLYELKSGGTARNLVGDALSTGNVSKLTEVSRRFFHTKAGYAAMYHLGVHYLDRDEPLAAALCFRRLLDVPQAAKQWEPTLSLRAAIAWNRAGVITKSKKLLAGFQKLNGGNPLRIGGRKIQPFNKESESLAWLSKHFGTTGVAMLGQSQWTMFRGNEARNGIALLPTKADATTWRATTISDPEYPSFDQTEKVDSENLRKLKSTIDSLTTANRAQNPPAIPKLHPLVIGNTLVARTTSALRTIDLRDGTRMEDTFLDTAIETQLNHTGNGPLSNFLQKRLWNDLSWGTLSTDGRYVYAIGFQSAPADWNSLMAFDSRTGKIEWNAGGPTAPILPEDRIDPLEGTSFLGAPLPLGDTLYCLAEINSEIRLLAIEYRRPPKGVDQNEGVKLLWSQPLVGARTRIDRDAWRRMSAASVSYADGVLVCCTDAGYVVGVELTSRSLLWAYKYDRASGRPQPFPRPLPPQRGNSTWLDFAATIADGRVLLTPRGTNEIVCLKLVDGTVAWKKPRNDGRYIAGVVEDTLIVAGDKSVRALDLETGNDAWKKPAAISELSGRGIIAQPTGRDPLAFIPAGKAGIVVLDVETGKQLGKSKLPGNHRPGNLVIAGGTMISQSVDAIDAFPVPLVNAK